MLLKILELFLSDPDWLETSVYCSTMSRDSILSFIDDCAKRIPPKQTGFLEYFQTLREMAADSSIESRMVAASLWLVLFKHAEIDATARSTWCFRFDEMLIGILQKLISRGFIGAGDTIEVASRPNNGDNNDGGEEAKIVKTFDIIEETMQLIDKEIHPLKSTNSEELKLIQLFLTASTSPNRAISGHQLGLALEKLGEIFRLSKETVNQNAARAAITQVVNERIEGTIGGSNSSIDQDEIFSWLCRTMKHERNPIVYTTFILDLVKSVLANNKKLFKDKGELSDGMGEKLLPIFMGQLNLKNDKIFDQVLSLLELIMDEFLEENKEFLEIILVYLFDFSSPSSSRSLLDVNSRPNIKASKAHLLTCKNKIRSIALIKKIFTEPKILFAFFQNYDADPKCVPIVKVLLRVISVFLMFDWHQYEGTRLNNSSLSELDCHVKIASTEALQSMIESLTSWYRSNENVDQDSFLKTFMNAIIYQQTTEKCIANFAESPRYGIDLAIKDGLIKLNSKEDIAKWVRFTRGIDKKAAGRFLGAPEQDELLSAFTETFDFSGQTFVESLCIFLEAFSLPGEAQIVERFMERFAQRLHDCDPQRFLDADVYFKLSYATMMLNTDLHSEKVKEKMTCNMYKQNTRSVVPEESISDKELEMIYLDIMKNEIKLKGELVEHPLPAGSRQLGPWKSPSEGAFSCALLISSYKVWSDCFTCIFDHFIDWQGLFLTKVWNSLDELLEALLSQLGGFIKIASSLKMEKELDEIFDKILTSNLFNPAQQQALDRFPNYKHRSLKWLYDLSDDIGSSLGISWVVILKCLSKFDLSTVVDEQHNIREIDLSRLDGTGLLAFLTGLIDIDQPEFTSHYLNRLYQRPSSQMEKIIRASYEQVGSSGTDSLFTLLAKISTVSKSCFLTSFKFMEVISQEHMPLIISLPNDAMFGYLRALETFSLCVEIEPACAAVEVFWNIGELLFAKNGRVDKIDDEIFFLKWYHVISGLSRVVVEHTQKEVVRVAIARLFNLLLDQGSVYQLGAWKVIWRSVLFPLLEEIKTRDSLLYLDSVNYTVQMMCKFDWTMEAFEFILKTIEEMATSIKEEYYPDQALKILSMLILENHQKRGFNELHWKLSMITIQKISTFIIPNSIDEVIRSLPTPQNGPYSIDPLEFNTLPNSKGTGELLNNNMNISTVSVGFPKTSPNLEIPDDAVGMLARKCTIQLILIEFIKSLVEDDREDEQSSVVGNDRDRSILGRGSKVRFEDIITITSLLLRLYEFAMGFNDNLIIRQMMVQAKLANNIESAVLSRQETGSLALLISMLYKLYRCCYSEGGPIYLAKDTQAQIIIANKYNEATIMAMRRYLEMKLLVNPTRRVGKNWSEIIQNSLKQWRLIYEMIDKLDSKVDNNLLLVSERMVETHFEVALELVTLSEKTVTVTSAKEFLRFSHTRLAKFYHLSSSH